MKTSKQTNQIAMALSRAQGQCEEAEKGGTGARNMKYERIQDLQKQSKRVFDDNGLSLLMSPYSATLGAFGIHWRLNHISGEYFEGWFEVPIVPKSAQELGGLLTYYRRYVLLGLLPLQAPDEDIDEVRPQSVVKGLPTKSGGSRKELSEAVTESVEATKKSYTPETEDDLEF